MRVTTASSSCTTRHGRSRHRSSVRVRDRRGAVGSRWCGVRAFRSPTRSSRCATTAARHSDPRPSSPRDRADAAGLSLRNAARRTPRRRRGDRRRRARRSVGGRVVVVDGEVTNRKITTPADLGGTDDDVDAHRSGVRRAPVRSPRRTGRSCSEESSSPRRRRLRGHSDADVVAHAVIDALLGAAGLGDIGTHFSDTDPRWKEPTRSACSRQAVTMVRDAGWQPGNVDCTVIAETPKVAPRRAEIEDRLVLDRRRAGHGQGEAGRGSRRDRPRRGHRVLRCRLVSGRSHVSPAKRGGGGGAAARGSGGPARSGAKPSGASSGGGGPSKTPRGAQPVRDHRRAAPALVRARRRPGRRTPGRARAAARRSAGARALGRDRSRRRVGRRRDPRAWRARCGSRCARSVATRWRRRPAPTRRKECSPRQPRCTRSSSTTSRRRATPNGAKPFLIVADGVTDPGNLGALLRSASCAGATGVVLAPPPSGAHHAHRREGGGRGDRAPADGAGRWHARTRSPDCGSSGCGSSGST